MLASEPQTKTTCAHCGIECDTKAEVNFCCNGCEQVYRLLHENGMSDYYRIEEKPGISRKNPKVQTFDYLLKEDAIQKLISYRDNDIIKVNFKLPAIHCSSCLWLLENLYKLNPAIRSSKVNFLEKKAYITFEHDKISLHELVVLLSKIGYEPELNFESLFSNKLPSKDRSLLLKIGVAGFSFGNIMLLSFPEYLGFHNASNLFFLGYLNIFLALPIFFYSGFDYLKDAWKDIVNGHLGIHVPLALGMITLFSRSLYEILSGAGEGYLDSFAGFVLFLLIGKWFQQYTERSIAFDRDYKSYFPIAVNTLINGEWISKSLDNVSVGDLIKIKNNEIIPFDGALVKGKANIDYSFVTGESETISIKEGSQIYAGGKQAGSTLLIKVDKRVDQGYLTQLWQENAFKQDQLSKAEVLLNHISKYFTIVIISIAVVTFLFWIFRDSSIAFQSVTAVLIVACPCALALSVPFILGNATHILSRFQFYVRSTETLEKVLDIDAIVFDKTGTITENTSMVATYSGSPLTEHDKDLIYSLTLQSNHPLSSTINKSLDGELLEIEDYNEHIGKGLSGRYKNVFIRLGSPKYIFGTASSEDTRNVIVEIDNKVIGYFMIKRKLRPHIEKVVNSLSTYKLVVLSGDNDREKDRMVSLFPEATEMKFYQLPKDKLTYIKSLQEKGLKVMMIGDGLNDAGALKQSDVGLVITEDNNTFTPACDAIISSTKLPAFDLIIQYIKSLRGALYGAFVIAFLYNAIGLGFAVTGNLSPIVAAILMPVSSITIMVYGLLSSRWLARKLSKNEINHKSS